MKEEKRSFMADEFYKVKRVFISFFIVFLVGNCFYFEELGFPRAQSDKSAARKSNIAA